MTESLTQGNAIQHAIAEALSIEIASGVVIASIFR